MVSLAYLTAVEAGGTPCEGSERLDAMAARHERLWLQLRTCDGTILQPSELRTLLSAPKFQAMLEAGLVHLQALHLRLTPPGFLLADAIGLEVLTVLEGAHAPG